MLGTQDETVVARMHTHGWHSSLRLFLCSTTYDVLLHGEDYIIPRHVLYVIQYKELNTRLNFTLLIKGAAPFIPFVQLSPISRQIKEGVDI